LVPFRALAVVLAVVYFLARKAQLSLSVIGVAVDFLQVVSLFSSFGFAWPEELTSLFKAASASTVNEQLVRGVVGFDEARKDVVSVIPAKFEPDVPVDLSIPWHKDEAVLTNLKSALLGLMFVAFMLAVVRPVVVHMMERDKQAALQAAENVKFAQEEALALERAQSEEAAAAGAGVPEPSAADTLEEMKAKMKAKKSGISAEMMDTANTYDDKVALIRMIVGDDSARVASVLKNMIKPS
jgi:flagellar M-ring protein FliF